MIADSAIIDKTSIIGSKAEWIHGLPDGFSYETLPEGKVIVCHNVVIREFVTVHSGVLNDTVIGQGSFLMNHCHIGHDAKLGQHVITAPGTVVGGHVVVGDGSYLGINSSVHQKAAVPRFSMLGANSFFKGEWGQHYEAMTWVGSPARPISVNVRGLALAVEKGLLTEAQKDAIEVYATTLLKKLRNR